MRGRKALILPLGGELHETIQRRRSELGLSQNEMLALLGWKGPNNLSRYRFKPNIMRATLQRTLDSLYADDGGWVEADKLWALVRERQALWGMTDDEMSAILGTTEARWIGKATARRILLTLTSPRRPCEFEQIRTQRESARHQRVEYRAKSAERQAS
jgi:transcriptional regulator with XRE-family HTH domain